MVFWGGFPLTLYKSSSIHQSKPPISGKMVGMSCRVQPLLCHGLCELPALAFFCFPFPLLSHARNDLHRALMMDMVAKENLTHLKVSRSDVFYSWVREKMASLMSTWD